MPTSRPRHYVTETDELSAALDQGTDRWPGLSRAQLLVQLALEGHRAIERDRDASRGRRLAALHQHSGALTGAYERDYRDELRAEWPS